MRKSALLALWPERKRESRLHPTIFQLSQIGLWIIMRSIASADRVPILDVSPTHPDSYRLGRLISTRGPHRAWKVHGTNKQMGARDHRQLAVGPTRQKELIQATLKSEFSEGTEAAEHPLVSQSFFKKEIQNFSSFVLWDILQK